MSDERHIRRSGSDYAEAFANLLPFGIAWPRHSESVLMRVVAGQSEVWGIDGQLPNKDDPLKPFTVHGVDARAADLLERESDPRFTIELLPEWERAWGLPDPCYEAPQSYTDRIEELLRRMTTLGAQSREFFIQIAADIGYEITITEYRTFVVGIDRVGDSRVYGNVNVDLETEPLTIMRNEWGNPVMDAKGDKYVDYGELSEWPYYGLGPEANRFYWTVHVAGAKLTWFRCAEGQCGIDPHLRIGLYDELECLLNRWKPAHTQIIFDYSGINPSIVDPPVISGTTTVGSTLTTTNGTWINDPVSYTYQWQRDRVNIEGATNNTYVLVTADIDTEIVCDVTATNVLGSSTASSIAINIPPIIPVATTPPVISGALSIGSMLSCTTGAWLYHPTGYSYQWQRGGVDIAGATGGVYILVYADAGASITCSVMATNSAGLSLPSISNALTAEAFATLDGALFSVTLSDGDLTATHSSAAYNSGVRSTKSKNSGKWYFEVLASDLDGLQDAVGLIPVAATLEDMVNGAGFKVYRDGSIYVSQGNFVASLGPIADGDRLQWAVDLDADLFWVRKNGVGYWCGQNRSPPHDPVTGTGGFSCATYSSTSVVPAVCFSGIGGAAGDNVTFNFGATPFTYPVPAGFKAGWTY